MSENLKLNYHEVDFIVPIHRFNIQFSYVTKQGLSFIREFVLRLVQLAPMKPSQIALYIGLNKTEVSEAISDLMDKGDLRFNEQGNVELTPQSEGYFSGLGKPPQISSILETSVTLSFELCGFNCIGSKRKTDGWKNGVELKIDAQRLSQTEELAKSFFQKEFYQYFDKKFLSGVKTEGSDRPSIYAISSVRKVATDSLRVSCKFNIDIDGRAIERDDFDVLSDSTEVHELITKTLGQNKKESNIQSIAYAMKSIGDYWTKDIFNDNSVDLVLFAHHSAESSVNDKKPKIFVGPIYSNENFDFVFDKIKNAVTKFDKSKDKMIKSFKWIAPSDSYWGQSSRIISILNEIEDYQLTKGDNAQRIFQPEIYLPLSDTSDKNALWRWKRNFGDNSQNIYAIIEGFMGGNVEVIYLENEFVVVCYHISRPETLPVTMPIGFISTDVKLIREISKMADEYINSISSYNKPNNLGLLKNL